MLCRRIFRTSFFVPEAKPRTDAGWGAREQRSRDNIIQQVISVVRSGLETGQFCYAPRAAMALGGCQTAWRAGPKVFFWPFPANL